MNRPPAFRQLQNFIKKQAHCKSCNKATKSESANSLTRRIDAYIRTNGGYATHLQSTGRYKADLRKFVPSQQRAGLPDVMAVINGRSCFVEVEVGRDTLRKDKKNAIAELDKTGASVFVTHDFDCRVSHSSFCLIHLKNKTPTGATYGG